MTPDQFATQLDTAVAHLNKHVQSVGAIHDPKTFEKHVLEALQQASSGSSLTAAPSWHPHAFPDIVVNGYGVEVKHTVKDSWLSVGNSVFEGMRDESVLEVYLVFGKMGGWPEVRWSKYEDCITHVRISHAPRYCVEMDRSSSLFGIMGIGYHEFRHLSPEEKMQHIRAYSRGRLKEGERLWWLEDTPDHALPLAVKVYRTLPEHRKRTLRAEATLLCPEVVQGGGKRGKYDRAGLYLITQHGIFAPQLRDLFSAGSVGARGGARGHKYIIAALRDIEEPMLTAAADLGADLFVEYWGNECSPERRIREWLKQADRLAPDWKPSAELFTG